MTAVHSQVFVIREVYFRVTYPDANFLCPGVESPCPTKSVTGFLIQIAPTNLATRL